MIRYDTEAGRRNSTMSQRFIRAVSLWMLLAFASALFRLLYLRFEFGIPCPFYTITGLLCPGCGMFRAIGALLGAAVWQAVRYNALAVILLPVLAIYRIRDTIRYVRAAPPISTSRPEMIFVVGAVAVSILYSEYFIVFYYKPLSTIFLGGRPLFLFCF